MSGFTKNVRLKIGKKKCPTDEMIDDYLLNRLNKKKEREIDLHLFECARCFKRVLDKKDLIDGVKIAFKNKSDVLEKSMKKSIIRILNNKELGEKIKEAVFKAAEDLTKRDRSI